MLQLRPGTRVEGGRLWTIALNDNQNLLGKCFLVLNRPCPTVDEIESSEWMDLQQQISRLKVALDSLFAPDHYNYAFLMNLDPQVDLHVIPRYRAARQWEGNTFRDDHFGSLFGTEQRMFSSEQSDRLSRAISRRLPAQS